MTLRAAILFIALTVYLQGEDINPVRWKITEQNLNVSVGKPFPVHITAEIEPEWHLYGLRKLDGGPIATTLTLEGEGFEIAGPIGASPPVTADDPTFGMKVDFYLGTVHFELPLRVVAGARPGRGALKVVARYQMCNDTMCLQPKRVTLEVPVEIENAAKPR